MLFLLLLCQAGLPKPDICHLYLGGEKNFRFQHTTDVEKSESSPHVEVFYIFQRTDAEKCEILPNLGEFQTSPFDRCEEI